MRLWFGRDQLALTPLTQVQTTPLFHVQVCYGFLPHEKLCSIYLAIFGLNQYGVCSQLFYEQSYAIHIHHHE